MERQAEYIHRLAEHFRVSIPEKDFEMLVTIFKIKEYKKGELILNNGQICRDIYCVKKGMIRLFYYKNGRDITEHFTYEGNIAVCIESFFLKKPTRLLIEALEDTTIYLIQHEELEQLCSQSIAISTFYRKLMEENMVLSQRKADSWRFETAHERYDRFVKEYPYAARNASVAHIASYLLMSPESLSRVRAGIL